MPESQPLVIGLIFLVAFVYFALLWKLSPGRRTWFAKLLTLASPLIGVIFVGLSFVGLPTWRAEVLINLATEVPVIFVLSAVCLAQAGRLPRPQALAFGDVSGRPRLRGVLTAAPAVLLGAWLFAGIAGTASPMSALEALSPAPPAFLLYRWAIVSPQAFYSGLVSWLFFKAAGSSIPALKLRLKNLFFAVGTFVWLLLCLNSLIHALVRVLLPEGFREKVATTQLGLESWLLATSLTAFGFGLAIRYVPVVNESLVRHAYPRLLGLQDRFESLRWHLVRGNKTRKLVRASYYTCEAAGHLKLPDADTEKSLTALQLTAIMGDPSADPERIASRTARELHPLQKEVMRDPALAARIKWSKCYPGRGTDDESETLASDPLYDALRAALRLTGAVPNDPATEALEYEVWYHLVAVAAADAGMIPRDRRNTQPCRPAPGSVAHAYEAAKNAAKLSKVSVT